MQFKNYYYALLALYGEVRLVYNSCDLGGLDILFIGGAFHGPHMDIYQQPGFIDTCNDYDITVVLISVEKIISNIHPTHIELYKIIARSKKFIHYTYDIDDCKAFGTKLFRVLMSKHYKNWINVDVNSKKDKIVFVGLIYQWRREVINWVSSKFPLDIYSNIPTWEEYIKLIAGYRYVLSPLGDANAFVAKFYEILLVHSIPIHQVRSDTLKYYDTEAKFPDCIFFEDVKELPKKLSHCKLKYSLSEVWLEDYLGKLLKEDGLLN
jgi:hypothetical protein